MIAPLGVALVRVVDRLLQGRGFFRGVEELEESLGEVSLED